MYLVTGVEDRDAFLRASGAIFLAGDGAARAGEICVRVGGAVHRAVVAFDQLAAQVGAGCPREGIREALRGPAAVGGRCPIVVDRCL